METWGIIWDPGAADGLMGTHTLLEYVRAFLYPLGLSFEAMGDQGGKSFAGIDGKPPTVKDAGDVPHQGRRREVRLRSRHHRPVRRYMSNAVVEPISDSNEDELSPRLLRER